MLRRPLVVATLAGLLSWSGAALADPPAAEKHPDKPAAPTPAPAPDKAEKPAPDRAEKKTDKPAKPGKADKTDKKEAAPEQPLPEATEPGQTPPDAVPAPPPEAPPTGGSELDGTTAEPGRSTAPTSVGPIGLWPTDQTVGAAPTPETATTAAAPAKSEETVFAEDWWSHARPVFEIHGFFRTRAELFHNFSLGRADAPGAMTWARPADDAYSDGNNSYGQALCTAAEAGGSKEFDNPTTDKAFCKNKTQAGANMRFRLDPELHVSDNLRVISQIDILDNVVLGSTPSSYQFRPASTGGGYSVVPPNGYGTNGVMDDTIVAPQSGVNSLQSSISVKRVWAEYSTPVGELRFGRMPDHFGLGMVHNSGDGYDDDYQSTIDRLQFISAIKPLDLYIGGSWDFPNEGPLVPPKIAGGQATDAAQLDDVNQWSLIVMRKQSPELVKNSLSHGGVVVNGGAYVTLRKQLLAADSNGQSATNTQTGAPNVPYADPAGLTFGYTRRNANIWLPDLWFQLRYKKFRFEAEGAAVIGSVDNTSDDAGGQTNYDLSKRRIREYGLATEIEQKLVEDKLRLGFGFGWASGDAAAYNESSTNNLIPQPGQEPVGTDKISTFRFHPAYRVDLILNRYLLQRIQGTYYVKPSVEYDFLRKPAGQRLGGGASIIWTRASEFVQTPGHARDLGVELDGRLYFQSKDGAINDRPEKMGGFYAMLEYGVMFPLAGLGYQPVEKAKLNVDTSAAQIMRLYLGVLF